MYSGLDWLTVLASTFLFDPRRKRKSTDSTDMLHMHGYSVVSRLISRHVEEFDAVTLASAFYKLARDRVSLESTGSARTQDAGKAMKDSAGFEAQSWCKYFEGLSSQNHLGVGVEGGQQA